MGFYLSKRAKTLISKRAAFEEPFLFSFLPEQTKPPKGYKLSRWVRPIAEVSVPHIPLKQAEKKMLEAINQTGLLVHIEIGWADRKFIVREHGKKIERMVPTDYVELQAEQIDKFGPTAKLPLINVLANYEKILTHGLKAKNKMLKKIDKKNMYMVPTLVQRRDRIAQALQAYKEHPKIIENIIDRMREQQGKTRTYRYLEMPQDKSLGTPDIKLDNRKAFNLEVALRELGIEDKLGFNPVSYRYDDPTLPLYVERGKNKIRTSRFLSQARKMLTKKIREAEATGKTTITLNEWMDAVESAIRQYEKAPRLENWSLIISAEPSDITTMSNRGWTSCMEEGKYHCKALDSGVDTRDLVAYAVSPEQKDWLARVWLRFDGKSGWWPEDKVYTHVPGLNTVHFLNQVEEYLRDNKILGNKGQFSPFARGYSDFLSDEIEYSTDMAEHFSLRATPPYEDDPELDPIQNLIQEQEFKKIPKERYPQYEGEETRPVPEEQTSTYLVTFKISTKAESSEIPLYLGKFFTTDDIQTVVGEDDEPMQLKVTVEAKPSQLHIIQALPNLTSIRKIIPKQKRPAFGVEILVDFKPILAPLLQEAKIEIKEDKLYDPEKYNDELHERRMMARNSLEGMGLASLKREIEEKSQKFIYRVLEEVKTVAPKRTIFQQDPRIRGNKIVFPTITKEQLSILIPALKRMDLDFDVFPIGPGFTPKDLAVIQRLVK